jgi:hypothetical protein
VEVAVEAVVVFDGGVLDGMDCAHERVAKTSASANPASATALEAFTVLMTSPPAPYHSRSLERYESIFGIP